MATRTGDLLNVLTHYYRGRGKGSAEGFLQSLCVAFSPDGRTLASSSWDNTIRLWDLETGKELRKLTGHRGKAGSLLFSVDAKTLISAGDDTTILFWDVAAVTRRDRRRAASLSAGEWDALWQDLAGADAGKAHRAITNLSAAPDQAVSFLQKRLRPAAAADQQRIARLVDDLESNRFPVREKATRELQALGETAEQGLRKALQRQRSPELHRRTEQVLDTIEVPSGDSLRAMRAVEVLEHIGSPEAKQILEALARGATEARLTQEARASLERLAKRSSAARS